MQGHAERDHRAGRQGHADVAADRGRVPDLERGQKGVAALSEQRPGKPGGRRFEGLESDMREVKQTLRGMAYMMATFTGRLEDVEVRVMRIEGR